MLAHHPNPQGLLSDSRQHHMITCSSAQWRVVVVWEGGVIVTKLVSSTIFSDWALIHTTTDWLASDFRCKGQRQWQAHHIQSRKSTHALKRCSLNRGFSPLLHTQSPRHTRITGSMSDWTSAHPSALPTDQRVEQMAHRSHHLNDWELF